MRAATWSEDFDLIDEITSITDELEEKNFGGIEQKTILRSISAAAGGGFSESSIEWLANTMRLSLRRQCRIPKRHTRAPWISWPPISIFRVIANCRYVNQVVVLSEVFRLLKAPTPDQLDEIKKWFWRTAASGYFGGWNTGNMAADQECAGRFVSGASKSLLPSPPRPDKSTWSAREFRSNAAHSKILILTLCFNAPIDLLWDKRSTSVFQALYHGNNKEFHHFFPRDYLKNSQGVDMRKANVLANIVMLTAASNKVITNRAPSDYLKQVETQLGSRLGDVLKANLIY